MKHRIQLFVVALFSIALLPLTSFAADEPPAITALFDAMKRQIEGFENPSYGSIETDGNGGAVLTDVTWTFSQPEVTMTVTTGRMVVSGVSQRANGAYSFKNVLSENLVLKVDLPDVGPVVLKMPSVPTTNLHILPVQSADGNDYSAFLGTMVYEKSAVPLTTITVAGQTFEIKNIIAAWAGDPDTGFGNWDFSMESAVVPVSAIPNPEFQKDMKEEFGIENFDLSMDGSAAIAGKNKNLDIAYAFRFTGKKVGSFEFAMAAQDIPGALGAVLKELQKGKEPNMGQLMPLLIGIKFAKLKMRFVDDNFTAKMLEFAAKKQGTTVEAMTSNGAALIQVGLMQLNLPEFSKTVISAYNTFTQNPGNISVEASPQAPVAMATLMGLIAAPAAAIKTLGVKVEANK